MAIDEGEPAVFLDKDGTLVENVPYNVQPELIRFAPNAGPVLQRFSQAGFRLCVVSNQSGVGRGYFPESALQSVEGHLRCFARQWDAELDGFYYCPHLEDDGCSCRKPATGMFLKASSDLGIDLRRSWMVGDILDDVEAGNKAGTTTILVDVGNETEWRCGPDRRPAFVVRDLEQACEIILRGAQPGGPA